MVAERPRFKRMGRPVFRPLQQLEILHVSGADLEQIYVFYSVLNGAGAGYFTDDGKSGGFPGFFHIF